jgi:hypothetical protein
MSLNIAQVAAEATKDIAAAPTTPTTPTTPVAPAATGESSAPAPNGANNGQPAAEAAAPPPANSD